MQEEENDTNEPGDVNRPRKGGLFLLCPVCPEQMVLHNFLNNGLRVDIPY